MGRDWRTKAEIAGHYQIGVRTVTKLMRRRILPYGKLRNLVRFDVAACDRAMEFFGNSSRPGGVKEDGSGRAGRASLVAGGEDRMQSGRLTMDPVFFLAPV